jgi:hypothetical protein
MIGQEVSSQGKGSRARMWPAALVLFGYISGYPQVPCRDSGGGRHTNITKIQNNDDMTNCDDTTSVYEIF